MDSQNRLLSGQTGEQVEGSATQQRKAWKMAFLPRLGRPDVLSCRQCPKSTDTDLHAQAIGCLFCLVWFMWSKLASKSLCSQQWP